MSPGRIHAEALPVALRRQLGATRLPPTPTAPRVDDAGRGLHRCHACGEETRSWAAAERHADQTTHRRIEMVLDAPQ